MQKLGFGYRHNISVPSSVNGVIIFPVDKEEGKFDSSKYSPELTQGAISTEEIEHFLQGIDDFVEPIFQSDVLSDAKSFSMMIILLMILLFVILEGVTMSADIPTFVVAPIFVVLMLVLAAVYAILDRIATSYVKKKIKEANEKIGTYLQIHNGAFKEKDYFWIAPVGFPYWIELHKEISESEDIEQGTEALDIQENQQNLKFSMKKKPLQYVEFR